MGDFTSFVKNNLVVIILLILVIIYLLINCCSFKISRNRECEQDDESECSESEEEENECITLKRCPPKKYKKCNTISTSFKKPCFNLGSSICDDEFSNKRYKPKKCKKKC